MAATIVRNPSSMNTRSGSVVPSPLLASVRVARRPIPDPEVADYSEIVDVFVPTIAMCEIPVLLRIGTCIELGRENAPVRVVLEHVYSPRSGEFLDVCRFVHRPGSGIFFQKTL